MNRHPLVQFVAEPSTAFDEEKSHPEYDPETQLQFHWNEINDHMEILASGKSTGDPDTRSATTNWVNGGSDDDTDDSGT